MPWIKIAPPEQAAGDLRRAYDKILATRGDVPEIRAVMACEPLVVEGFAFFYPDNNYACRSIDRRLAEMIATVVAVSNRSEFGKAAHSTRLATITGDSIFVQAILHDYSRAGLSNAEQTLLDYVWKLSKTPSEMTQADIEGLRAVGWTDPQIVATVHVASFFSYMNRVAEAFGLSER